MNPPNPTGGPLSGYRVVDFTNFLAGPYATRMLADMGAEVIKVELVTGDAGRHNRPFQNGVSVYYAHLYAGKKSVTLNLKTEQGQAAAFKLGAKADVIVQSWRPGVAKRLGLDYEAFRAVKEDIVLCSISGYGQNGPGRERAGYAPIVEAMSGFATAQMKFDHTDQPPVCGHMLGDTLTGVWAFAAIQTALLDRERTGRGGHLDVAMLDAMLFASPSECQEANVGPFLRRNYPPLKTLDGYMIVAPTSEQNFQQLALSIGHPEWLEDPRFNPLINRTAHWKELMRMVGAWSSVRTTEQCEDVLYAGGVPCGRFRSYAEAMKDPQVIERGSFSKVTVGGADYCMPNVPFQITGVATQVRPLIAELGQHNTEVLGELLNYSEQQIRECSGAGTAAASPAGHPNESTDA